MFFGRKGALPLAPPGFKRGLRWEFGGVQRDFKDFCLLESGITMPHSGVVLPLLALFVAAPTPIVYLNWHHIIAQIVIYTIRLGAYVQHKCPPPPAPPPLTTLAPSSSEYPMLLSPSPPVVSSRASSFSSRFCPIYCTNISFLAFIFLPMVFFTPIGSSSSLLFSLRLFYLFRYVCLHSRNLPMPPDLLGAFRGHWWQRSARFGSPVLQVLGVTFCTFWESSSY